MSGAGRRQFLAGTAAAAGVAMTGSGSAQAATVADYPLVHHVFFWLKNPDSAEDLEKLLEGIKGLGEIPTVRAVHVGVPASTEARGVVDHSWSASEILYFDDEAGQAAYQVHPLHVAFADMVTPMVDRVVVYDARAAK
ncbi:Dabb family protein [Marinihelvus fidelis]|uniref:Dabb family protein n=1 Tax=Marinihelvus fidelis TaxID=2613842 RepID=A0A5N0TCI8_9GAMM|nr:Dabb family protein [Marinihelvus fidelis]KAA9132680.1 Dabb family protein [Marinihelvus fidelis]